MIVHSLHVMSVIVLLGTGAALRLIVLPALRGLKPEDATQLKGEVMLRARLVLWVSLIISWGTGLYILPWYQLRSLGPVHLKVMLAIALTIVVVLLAVSPHRRLWLKMRPHQRLLLDALLILGLLIIWLSPHPQGR